MTGIINTYKTNAAICEALGLDPSKLTSITIKLSGNSAPHVEVGMFLTMDQTLKLAPVLAEYTLVPKAER